MSIRNLAYLLSPKSVALIGASPRPLSVGQVVFSNVVGGGFKRVYAVNPRHQHINGFKSYPDVATLPEPPDLAVIMTPAETVPDLITALGQKGTRAAIVLTAGFGEGQHEAGVQRRDALLRAARPYLMRILGPNCLGVMLPHCQLNASFARTPAKPGGLALVTQSGAIAATLLDWAQPRHIGFSHVATLGDTVDVDFGDMLDYLATDSRANAILMYVEAITQPRKFMSAARAAARLKPVIVVKGGRFAESAKAAASHTGALAGADDVYEAMFARAGVLRVRELRDLFDAAAVLAQAPRLKGDRLGIVTNGGGFGVLAADDLIAKGGHLPFLTLDTLIALDKVLPDTWSHANPVDIIGDAPAARYDAAVSALLADPNVDAVLAMHCPTAVIDPLEAARSIAIAAGRKGAKPIVAAWLGDASMTAARDHLVSAGVPTFETPEEAVGGVMHAVNYGRLRNTLMEVPPAADDIPGTSVDAARDLISPYVQSEPAWLSPDVVRRLLAYYDIPTPRSAFAATADEAATIADSFNTLVAVKIVSPDIPHKSDVNGVILNLRGGDAVRAAAVAMREHVAASRPDARLAGFSIEEMIFKPQGHELLIGMTVDPTFGPVLAFGRGGTAVEVINDKALEFPPLNLNLAHAMIGRTRIAKMLGGFRATPPANIDRIARTIVNVSQMIADHPCITDVDINPLLADPHDLIALDARVRVCGGKRPGMIIKPYPRELEQFARRADGTRIFIRPMRPDDETLLHGLIEHLSREDMRFRFFIPYHHVDHGLTARLTQIDYDREMSLVALESDGTGGAIAVASFCADPDKEAAEFAIIVHPDRQNQGVGLATMRVLMEIARREGIQRFYGNVLSENARMLKLAKSLGMRARASSDRGVTCVEIQLQGAA